MSESEKMSRNPKNKNLNSEELGLKGVLDEVISEAGDSTPNAPENQETVDPERASRDEALFRSIAKQKKKKRNKVIRTVVIIVLLIAIAGFIAVSYLQHKVQVNSVSSLEDVIPYTAVRGNISTTVSGSGTLSNVDEEYIRVPDGVEIEDVVVEANQKVQAGDVIAELDMSTVRSTMASVQEEIEELDGQIYDAAADTINKYITAGVGGRVKAIYSAKGDLVADSMYDHGALAIISLGGKMALKIDANGLNRKDSVLVARADSSKRELKGTVDSITNGTAVVLVTDDGPEIGETVTVKKEDGTVIGTSELYLPKALKVTGISGKISSVRVSVNHTVKKGDVLFELADTTYSAAYESLIKQRGEKEELLLDLVQLNRDGALLAPFTGSVGKVIYDDGDSKAAESASASSSASAGASAYSGMMGMSMMSMASMTGASSAASASASSASGSSEQTEEGKIDVVTLSPDELMEVSVSVDESHILSLEIGQTATLTISSIGTDTYTGMVTEIDKTANSSSGVTKYSATITLKKDDKMLPGMTAKAVVRIQGVDNAIIIPVEALHQTSSTSFVYTSYDPELAEYGGLVKVEAGISNSSYAEIISGLKEGDVIYYVEAEDNGFGFGMGGSFGGGMHGGGMRGGRG